ncbi:MAG: hypothetical protein RJA99_4586 [Pseudomonadota bacterium]
MTASAPFRRGDPLLALAIDSLKQGVLLFDAAGHVLVANTAAQRTIRQHRGIAWVPSPLRPHDRVRLQLRGRTLQLRLERALRLSVDAGLAQGRPGVASDPRSLQVIALADESGQPALIVQLMPTDTAATAEDPDRPAVLGLLIDRSSSPALEPAMLRDLFGLTEAESRVAEAYLRADTVKEVGGLLGVSVNTVKTHLASVYQKTGCTRQAQLVRLLMALSGLGEDAGAGPAPH